MIICGGCQLPWSILVGCAPRAGRKKTNPTSAPSRYRCGRGFRGLTRDTTWFCGKREASMQRNNPKVHATQENGLRSGAVSMGVSPSSFPCAVGCSCDRATPLAAGRCFGLSVKTGFKITIYFLNASSFIKKFKRANNMILFVISAVLWQYRGAVRVLFLPTANHLKISVLKGAGG